MKRLMQDRCMDLAEEAEKKGDKEKASYYLALAQKAEEYYNSKEKNNEKV